MEKILLDTDIGSDIDDAVCLAYLLAEPQCELVGITTVQGDPHERAMLASALIYQSGKQVPIFEGTKHPILGEGLPMGVPQARALGKWAHDTKFSTEWLEFMRDTIRKKPHEITLLAIGPMTNVALLFAVDPEIPALLKRLVLMCGAFCGEFQTARRSEYNAKGDPCATAAVYAASCEVHRSVGLDVTLQVYMDSAQAKAKFTGPLLTPVLDMAGVWFEQKEKMIFHDPLAAVSIFHPEVVAYERGVVHVDLEAPGNPGFTGFTPSPTGNVEIAREVDPELVMKHYFSVF